MFYDIEKLEELDKQLSANLMKADNHTWKDDYRIHWQNYRNDVPNCLMVIRELKDILRQLKTREEK